MTKTLIIHGLDGSPAPHWQHWWAASEHDAILVDLPSPAKPDPRLWEIELAGTVLRHPGAILVGHSLGAVLIARVLAKWPQLNIRAALLVAPAETEGATRIGHFGPIPTPRFDVPATLVASRNDPWMSYSRARSLAASFGAGFFDMGFAGHINVASGFGPWQQGRALRDDLLAQSAPAPLSPNLPLSQWQGVA